MNVCEGTETQSPYCASNHIKHVVHVHLFLVL